MFKGIASFFDRLEDKVRVSLSHRSFVYAFIGGACTVIFWRGVWHTSDIIMTGEPWMYGRDGFWGLVFYEPITVVWASLVLLMTGLFVSNFIGERVIISGLKKEKKVTDRTEGEVKEEEDQIVNLNAKLDVLVKDITVLKDALAKK